MDIRKIYEYALQREHEGKRFFETNTDRLQHAAAQGAFRQLAGEEQKHIDFITSLIGRWIEQSASRVVKAWNPKRISSPAVPSHRALNRQSVRPWCLTCRCCAWLT
jgi:rubrerythrin